MHTIWIAGVIVVAGSAVATYGAFIWNCLRNPKELEDDESAGFALARYHIMSRLLDSAELDYLRAQPGFTSKMERRWKRDRRDILRSYLSDLTDDFSRLHARARQLMTEAPEENADLLDVLMHQQMTFWSARIRVEMGLMGHALGVSGVDLQKLFSAAQGMDMDLDRRRAIQVASF